MQALTIIKDAYRRLDGLHCYIVYSTRPLQWAADLKRLKAALLFGTMIFVMHKYKTVLYA